MAERRYDSTALPLLGVYESDTNRPAAQVDREPEALRGKSVFLFAMAAVARGGYVLFGRYGMLRARDPIGTTR